MILFAAVYAELASRVHNTGRHTFALVIAGAAIVFLLWPVRKDRQ